MAKKRPATRQQIEDLCGLKDYYVIEEQTVEMKKWGSFLNFNSSGNTKRPSGNLYPIHDEQILS